MRDLQGSSYGRRLTLNMSNEHHYTKFFVLGAAQNRIIQTGRALPRFGSLSLDFWCSPNRPQSRPQSRPRTCTIRSMSNLNQTPTIQPEHGDFFRYTSGRWVWDEEQQLQDRYNVFNVTQLQHIAAKCVDQKAVYH